MFTSKQIKGIINKLEILPEKEFNSLIKEAKNHGKSIENYLIEKKIISSASLYESAAEYFNIPFINLKNQIIRKDILFNIPEPIAFTHQLIAFDKDNSIIKIATLTPDNLDIFEFINKTTGLEPKIFLTTPDSIKEALQQYHKSLKAEFNNLQQQDDGNKEDLQKIAEDMPIIRVVNTLLEYAIYQEASDIHIEPNEKNIVVRYRIDGILHNVMELPKTAQSGIIARIKILSNLKIDEHRMPQDGRFKICNKEYKISFRVSIIPTINGEKIVMRLLNEKAQILTLEQLGLQPKSFEAIQRNIKKPNGMILVTGPTGSGKTTTLYTILNILNTPQINICTVEDPIEYSVPGINQSQISAKIGFTFATGLRALLRQDPDIIMVGEIRDNETAEIAVHAAMTGHLVLSTLHTNDAIGTLARINRMGVSSFLIADTTNVIIAQRLVRKICSNCIQSYNLDQHGIQELKKQFNVNKLLDTLEKEKIISNSATGFESLLFYRGKGCKKCDNSGYKGRIGIYEVLEITEEISEAILQTIDLNKIQKLAKKQNLATMIEDGFIKAKNGITTIEEIIRVAKE
ncbi:GspE/PulE family protein [Patescibacteria group bacterium]|nr:GspE/PulE family protein [Patescibacteria group bacterium]